MAKGIDADAWSDVRAGTNILTFDVSKSKPQVWGTSRYDVGSELRQVPWDDLVTSALQLACIDVNETTALSGLEEPLDDVWFCATSVNKDEADELPY